MGGEFTERNAEIDGRVAEQGNTDGKRTDSTSTSTANSADGNGRGTGRGTDGRGTGRADGKGNTEEKIVPQLVTVNDGKTEEERKKEERNAKRRERYAKQKAENGQAVKPRKVNKTKKAEEPQMINREQINALIVTVSATIASRPNCEQWLLSESEVDAITKPLMAMIAESDKIEMLAEHSNQIALAVACVSVFAPRVLVTVQKMKAEKEKEKNVRQTEQAKADTERLNKSGSGRNATNDKKPDNELPFFGVPISG